MRLVKPVMKKPLRQQNRQIISYEINTIPGSLAAYLFKDMSRQELLDRCINLAFRKERNAKKIVSTIESSLLKNSAFDGIKK